MRRAVLAGFVLGLGVLVAPAAVTAARLTQAPDLTLDDIHGKKVAIHYDASELTLVNFWATWCIPCHEEMPQLAALGSKYARRGFKVYGIAVESGSASAVRDFVAANPELGINYPLLMGNPEVSSKFGGVEAIPTSFLIDARGRVVKSFVGVDPHFRDELEADLERLLPRRGRHEKGSQTAPSRRRHR